MVDLGLLRRREIDEISGIADNADDEVAVFFRVFLRGDSVALLMLLNCTRQCLSSDHVRMTCMSRRSPSSPVALAGLEFRLMRSPPFSRKPRSRPAVIEARTSLSFWRRPCEVKGVLS